MLQQLGDRLAGRDGWEFVPWRRTAACGRVVVGDGVEVRVTHGDDGPVAYPVGTLVCGSVWNCPQCSAKVRARRQMEVTAAAQRHSEDGGALAMLTLTVRHTDEMALAEVLDGLMGAWRSLQQSARWRADLRPLLVGTIRALEVTHGFTGGGSRNGWHPHLHVLLLLRPGVDQADVEQLLSEWLAEAWAERVDRRLGLRPDLEHGAHLLGLDASAAAYVAKIGAEIARGDLKGSRQIWAVLDAAGDGEAWAAHRWSEWCTAMGGKRSIQWSKGLRALLLPDVEDLSDEEIAEQEVDGETVEVISADDWLAMCRAVDAHGVPRAVRYLELVEDRARCRGPGPPSG